MRAIKNESIFVTQQASTFSLLFSLHFGEKSFCGPGWKMSEPHTKVFFLLLQTKQHTNSFFSHIFSLNFFILLISPSNKHTLRGVRSLVKSVFFFLIICNQIDKYWFSLMCVWLEEWKNGKMENSFIWLERKNERWKM